MPKDKHRKDCHKRDHKCDHKEDHKRCHKKSNKHEAVYAEFIRTFTFDGQVQLLPIVQPGGSLTFPIPTVPPKGVKYVEDQNRVGLLVPKGVYLVAWSLNPSEGANVNLLVNGNNPITPTMFAYGRSITTTGLDNEFLINAPLKHNFISLINGGTSLFTLNDIANSHVGNTAVITHVRIIRID